MPDAVNECWSPNEDLDDWMSNLVQKRQQQTPMKFCPAYGCAGSIPDIAAEYRDWHGNMAWLYNPWTGAKRDPQDIGSDVFGHLIIPPEEQVYAIIEN